METVQMQTSTAIYKADIADKNLLAWQAPRLQVRSIAAITLSNSGTPMDGGECGTGNEPDTNC
jgi:hypothetical protein